MADSSLRVFVRGYWRRSRSGRWHFVGDYRRHGLVSASGEAPPPTVGGGAMGVRAVAGGLVRSRSRPWVETRYLLRYRGEDGRKHTAYLPRAVGEAWRDRVVGRGNVSGAKS